jgi:23S rRNA pseudouridine2605 synthase
MPRKNPNKGEEVVASAPSPERIAKVMARAGLCSRRIAEHWIVAGRVSVNGAVIASPALNVSPTDTILVEGKPLPARERTRLFLYHKPRGLVTTASDPERRPTIFAALPKQLPRLVSVGRLDLTSEGLLLLTNDGALAGVLESPRTGWLRRYRVRAHGRVTQAQLDALRAGIGVEGVQYRPIEATLEREQGTNLWLNFAIREGKNREIRAIAGALGLQVNRLIRVSFGPFQLGTLPPGGIVEVKTRTLREQLGGRIAAAAGAEFSAPVLGREAPAPNPAHAHTPGVRPNSLSKPTPPRRGGAAAPGKTKRSHAEAAPLLTAAAVIHQGRQIRMTRIDAPSKRPTASTAKPHPQKPRNRRR